MARRHNGTRPLIAWSFLVASCLLAAGSSAAFVLSLDDDRAPRVSARNTKSAASRNDSSAGPVHIALDGQKARYLVRASLKSMHDALQTGNFTVLRDLASDSFRNRYSAAKLAAKFMPRGVAEFDLSAAVLEEPVIMAARQIDGATGVYLSGAVSSNPGAPLFSIAIVPAEGKWALADIVVELRQPIALAAGPSTITPPANDR